MNKKSGDLDKLTKQDKKELQKFEEERIAGVWLNQKKIAEIFGVELPTISYHLKEIYSTGELTRSSLKITVTLAVPPRISGP